MTVHELLAPTLARRSTRWNRRAPVAAAALVDLVLLVVVTFAAGIGRAVLPIFVEAGDVPELVATAGPAIVLGWFVVIALHGGYAPHLLGAGTQEYKVIVRASFVAAGAIGVISFLGKVPLSRGFFFLLIIGGIPLLLLGRHLLRRLVHALRRRGHLCHRVLVAGGADSVDEIAAVLHREPWLGFTVVGALVPASQAIDVTPAGIPVLGTTARTAAVVSDTDSDIVLFAGGAVATAQQMRRAAWDLEDSDVQIMLVPSLTDVATDRVRARPAAGLHLMELEGPRAHRASRVSKRAFDIVGAGLCLLVASPVLVAAAVAVRLHDGGPVVFRQRRVGRHGDFFDCLKFRSMVVGADALRPQVEDRNMHGDEHVLFKDATDPRITPPGRVMRRFSVDETPQFVNVLRGDMSLVGPRPPLPGEVEQYTDDVRTRLAVRPGMTGLWQVSGRSDLSWEDSVRLDLYYVDNWSLVQDLAILWRTVSAVLGGRGAY